MTFPTIPTGARIVSSVQQNTTATRTQSLTGLTKNSGDLLIAIFVGYFTSTGTNAAFSGWTSNWTEFHDSATSSTLAIGMAYKWSDGTETTVSATQASTITGHCAMMVMSIAGANLSTPPEAGSRASQPAGSTLPDPASFNPTGWDVEDTLWIAVGAEGQSSASGAWTGLGTAPTNFTNAATSTIADVLNSTQVGAAFRQQAAASQDVGTWAADTSNSLHAAVVIAVRPKPSVTNSVASAWNLGASLVSVTQTQSSAWNVEAGFAPNITFYSTSSDVGSASTVTVLIPATTAGDAVFLHALWKASDLALSPAPALSGYTLMREQTFGSGGYVDGGGSYRAALWRKDTVATASAGTSQVSVTPSTANGVVANAVAFTKGTGDWGSFSYSDGGDTTADTTISVASQTQVTQATGRRLVAFVSSNATASITGSSFSTSGVTYGAYAAHSTALCNVGYKGRIHCGSAPVDSGSQTGVTTLAGTNSATAMNGVFFVSLLEVQAGTGVQQVTATTSTAWNVRITDPVSQTQASAWAIYAEATPVLLGVSGLVTGLAAATTTSFTPTAGAVIFAVSVNTGSTTENTTDPTIEDTWTLTWNLVTPTAGGGNLTGGERWWWAEVPSSPGSGSVTVTLASAATAQHLIVFEVAGADTTTPIAGRPTPVTGTTETSLSSTLAATPTTADVVIGITLNRNKSTAPTVSSVGSFTSLSSAANAAPSASYLIQYDANTTSTSINTNNIGTNYSVLDAFIVKASGGTTSVTSSTSSAWHVKAGVEKTASSAWDVTETVTSSMVNSAWHVLVAVPQSVSSAWNVNEQITASATSAWQVKAEVIQTQTSAWDALSIIEGSKPVAWHVLLALSQSVDSAWQVKAEVTQTQTSAWEVLGAQTSVSQSVASAWKVNAEVTQSSASAWCVLTAVPQSVSSAWRVLAQVLDPTAPIITDYGYTTGAYVTYTPPAGTTSVTIEVFGQAHEDSENGGYAKGTLAYTGQAIRYRVRYPASHNVEDTSGVNVVQADLTDLIYASDGWDDGAGSSGVGIGWVDTGRLTDTATSDDTQTSFVPHITFYAVGAGGPVSKTSEWDVLYRLQQTKPSAWDVTTTVTPATATSAWSISAQVPPQSVDSTWRVLASVEQVEDSAWYIASAFTTVSASQTSSWNTLATVEQVEDSSWKVDAQLTQSTDAAWDVLVPVEQTRAIAWHVASPVTAEQSSSWDVTTTVPAQSADASWDVLTSVPQSADSAWRVLAPAEQVEDSAWAVAEQVTASIDVAWKVDGTLTSVTPVVSSAWRVLEAVEQTQSSAWDVTTVVPQSVDTAWAVAEQVSQSVGTAWAIDEGVTQSVASAWAVEAAEITATVDTAWDVLVAVPQSAPVGWRVLEQVDTTSDSAWDVTTTLTPQTVDTAWDITTSVLASVDSAWRALVTVSQSALSAWGALASIEGSASSAWQVLAIVEQTAPAAWAIDEQATQTVASAWSITGSVTGTASSAWNVDGSVLAVPSGLTAVAVSRTQINLSWNAVNGATGYDIERDSVVIVTDHATTTYPDSGLGVGTEHTYRVRAVKV